MSDEQESAEQLDEDVILGDDEVWAGDEPPERFPPEHYSGVPFADADVTDESLADRFEQMEPDPEPDPGDDEQPPGRYAGGDT